MSQVQDNASAFATTAESAIDMERNSTRERVLGLLYDARPGRALYELVRSVQRQARLAGISTAQVPVPCPCGGRCAVHVCATCQGQGEVEAAGQGLVLAGSPNLRLVTCGDCDGTGDPA